MSQPKCPSCQGPAQRAIYMGLPMWLCLDDACACLWGFWSYLLAWEIVPFNGMFYLYEGHYLPALWRWLREPMS